MTDGGGRIWGRGTRWRGWPIAWPGWMGGWMSRVRPGLGRRCRRSFRGPTSAVVLAELAGGGSPWKCAELGGPLLPILLAAGTRLKRTEWALRAEEDPLDPCTRGLRIGSYQGGGGR